MSDLLELFGGEIALKRRISEVISDARVGEKLMRDELAAYAQQKPEVVEALENLENLENGEKLPARSTLLSFFWALGLALERVMPLPLMTESQTSSWIEKMTARGAGPVASADGQLPANDAVALGLFLRMEALSAICAPPDETHEKGLEEIRRRMGIVLA